VLSGTGLVIRIIANQILLVYDRRCRGVGVLQQGMCYLKKCGISIRMRNIVGVGTKGIISPGWFRGRRYVC
jgi:hypothetical protein